MSACLYFCSSLAFVIFNILFKRVNKKKLVYHIQEKSINEVRDGIVSHFIFLICVYNFFQTFFGHFKTIMNFFIMINKLF